MIGGGILGLATARSLLRARPGARVVVLEAEPQIASHQTGRASGVVHRGLYYEPGSLKARLCVAGAEALLAYCDEHGVAYRTRQGRRRRPPEELPRLEELHRRGVANGVPDLRRIDRDELRELEPHAAGVAGLHSPQTAVVDFGAVANAIGREVTAGGGEIRTNSRVTGIARRGPAVLLSTASGEIEARRVVACAGVYADRVAALSGGRSRTAHRAVPGRLLGAGARGAAARERPPLSRPRPGVPVPRRAPDDSPGRVGAARPERGPGVRSGRLPPPSGAARRLLGRSLRTGVPAVGAPALAHGAGELARDWSRRLLVRAARRLLPELDASDLRPAPRGFARRRSRRTGR